jgi:hypothetical protein
VNLKLFVVGAILWTVPCGLAQPAANLSANTLSPAEKAAGWKLLFDGKTGNGWRGYKKPGFPDKGWVVEDGCLKVSKGGGDIITADQYGDFELTFDFKVSEKGNSGVMYRVAEKHDTAWQTGPEFQILDDAGYGKELTDMQLTGSCYDLYPPAPGKKLNPAGQFNTGRIRLTGGVLQHFVNDAKTVECRVDGDEWKQKIAGSKFKGYEGFGVLPKGHIALQEHGADIWFRNVKIRDLSSKMPGEVVLFDGKNMDAWTFHLNDNGKMEDVWSIQDGVLICKGNPIGYIRTKNDYTNYVLKLDWRFNPVTKKAGNSGVLLRVQAPDKVWPKSVEAQLQHENAGDFWNIDEFPMQTVKERLNGRNTKKTQMAERALGEWNEYEIIVDHNRITLRVNGQTLNEAWDVQEVPGKIALQSEGAEIHFRNVRLAPIE